MLKTYTPLIKQLNPVFWVDVQNENSWSNFAAYQATSLTGSGTSGTTTITASASIGFIFSIGDKIRIGATDVYTISNISGSTITTAETLSTNYTTETLNKFSLSQISDLSGKQYHLAQGTASAQPSVNKVVNGRKFIYFDRTDDWLQGTNSDDLDPRTGGFSIFFVYKLPLTSNQQFLFTKGAQNTTMAGWAMYRNAASSPLNYFRFNNGTTLFNGTWNDSLGLNVNAFIFNGSDCKVYENGTLVTTIAYTGDINATTPNLTIGARSGSVFSQIDFGEMVIIKREVSSTERDMITKFLGNKWGVTVV